MKIKNAYIFLFVLLFSSMMTKAKDLNSSVKVLDLANHYYNNENYPLAMKYYTRGMELAEQDQNDQVYCICTGYISNIYANYGDYLRALHYLNVGYQVTLKHRNLELQGSFLRNLVNAYCHIGDVGKAKYYYVLSLNLPDRSHNDKYFDLYNKARIARAEGKLDDAVLFHRQAYFYAKKYNCPPIYQLYQYSEIGNIFIKQGKYQVAFKIGQSCLEKSKRLKSRELMANAYQILAQVYKHNGNRSLYQRYEKLFVSLSDSVHNIPNLNAASTQLFEYENRRNDEHINSLNGKLDKQFYVIVVISALFFILMTLFFLLLRNNRHLHDAQVLLIHKNRELEKSGENREMLLKQYLGAVDETHHSDSPTSDNAVIINQEQKNRLLSRIMFVMNDVKIISNPDFNLNMLAEAISSNTKYVSMVINESYNKNFKTLLNESRIREATRRLSDLDHYGNITIQAIYEDVGYKNAVSFIRAFKKVYGMTPSVYQKLIRNSSNHVNLNSL